MRDGDKIMNCVIYHLYLCISLNLFVAMGLTVEVVVEVTVPTRAMVSLAVTVSRATEGTTRALTATLAPTTREDMAAMVNLSQVEEDFLALHNHTVSYVKMAKVFSWLLLFTLPLGGYDSPSSNQGGGSYSHATQSYSSGGYNNNNQSSNMSYSQQSSFSGYSQQPPPPSPSG